MFWGLSGCPPDTVERVLKTYNEMLEKSKQREKEKQAKKMKSDKIIELMKKNPPKSFKDILEYTMIASYEKV
jgi:hypothetical protein